jgi:hypothetical protein
MDGLARGFFSIIELASVPFSQPFTLFPIFLVGKICMYRFTLGIAVNQDGRNSRAYIKIVFALADLVLFFHLEKIFLK